MHKRRHQSGITLLEIMVVVAIVGVFASLSVVGFQQMMERQRVSGAQRELLMLAQDARQMARARLQPVRLNVWAEDENGVLVTRARWEALPCSNEWGTECPVAACVTSECGASGCTCPEMSEPIVIPRGLDAEALDGVCWLGVQEPGSGVPATVMGVGGRTCDAANPPPADGDLLLRRNMGTPAEPSWQRDTVLLVDGLTGAIRSVDCEKSPGTPGCAGD